MAIEEKQAKAAKTLQPSKPVRNGPKASETNVDDPSSSPDQDEGVMAKSLEREVRDLKITNQANDYYIDRLEKVREGFVEKLMISSHRIGELEAKLLQLEPPNESAA